MNPSKTPKQAIPIIVSIREGVGWKSVATKRNCPIMGNNVNGCQTERGFVNNLVTISNSACAKN